MLPEVAICFRLSASCVDFSVDVRLRCFDGRWIAVAEMSDTRHLGLGATARAALTAALSALPPTTATALLADPQLFDVSRRIEAAGKPATSR